MNSEIVRSVDPQVALGVEIRRLRREKQWTQKTLAAKSGVNENELSGYENARRQPGTPHLRKIATALGVPLAHLLKFGFPYDPHAPRPPRGTTTRNLVLVTPTPPVSASPATESDHDMRDYVYGLLRRLPPSRRYEWVQQLTAEVARLGKPHASSDS